MFWGDVFPFLVFLGVFWYHYLNSACKNFHTLGELNLYIMKNTVY